MGCDRGALSGVQLDRAEGTGHRQRRRRCAHRWCARRSRRLRSPHWRRPAARPRRPPTSPQQTPPGLPPLPPLPPPRQRVRHSCLAWIRLSIEMSATFLFKLFIVHTVTFEKVSRKCPAFGLHYSPSNVKVRTGDRSQSRLFRTCMHSRQETAPSGTETQPSLCLLL